jgi:hypothetical protein
MHCREKCHNLSIWKKMDPEERPFVLDMLTQVEEMLIERVNPIMQVTLTSGGQYKYSIHTINFP